MKIDIENVDFEDFVKSIPEGEYAKASLAINHPYVPLMFTDAKDDFGYDPTFQNRIKARYTKKGPKSLLSYYYDYFGENADYDDLLKIMQTVIDLGFCDNSGDKIIWKHQV